MTTGLHLTTDGMILPLRLASERIVILGKSGCGKSSADTVLVEEFTKCGITVAVVDILGNMHGLRAAGTKPGLPIVILGGFHGDVEINPKQGSAAARIVGAGTSCILDVSQFQRSEAQEFVSDFLESLIPEVRSSHRRVHVVFEEGETWAPKTASGAQHKTVRSSASVFARTARNFAIGWTFSTQRPQSLSNDVIDSSSVFVAMRLTGSRTQNAIRAEVESRLGDEQAKRVFEDLSGLDDGEAWLVPDGKWLLGGNDSETRKIRFRLRNTYDSARNIGFEDRPTEQMASVSIDISQIRESLKYVKEGQQTNSVGKICDHEREIASLKERVSDLLGKSTTVIERPVLDVRLRDNVLKGVKNAEESLSDLRKMLEQATVAEAKQNINVSVMETKNKRTDYDTEKIKRTKGEVTHGLGLASRSVLNAVGADKSGIMKRSRIAAITGYSIRKSTIRNAFTDLRNAGLIVTYEDKVELTALGRKTAGPPILLPNVTDRITMWRDVIKEKSSVSIFDALVMTYPRHLSREEIGKMTGIRSDVSTIRNAVSRLNQLGILTREGDKISIITEIVER